MSYKVKNSDIRAIMSNEVTLFSARKLEVKTIYWLSRLQKELVNHYRAYEEERLKLNQDYCLVDEKGRPSNKDGQFQFASEEKRAELIAKVEELAMVEVEFGGDKMKILLEQLKEIINSNEIVLLEPFVDFIFDAPGV